MKFSQDHFWAIISFFHFSPTRRKTSLNFDVLFPVQKDVYQIPAHTLIMTFLSSHDHFQGQDVSSALFATVSIFKRVVPKGVTTRLM